VFYLNLPKSTDAGVAAAGAASAAAAAVLLLNFSRQNMYTL